MCCKLLDNIKSSPSACTPGYVKGLILFKDNPTALDLQSITQTALQALADEKPPANLMYVPIDFKPELTDREIVSEETIGGGINLVDTTKGADVYTVFGNGINVGNLHKELQNSQIMYVYFITRKKAILGKLSPAKTALEAVRCNVWTVFTADRPDASAKVHINVQELEDWDARRRAVELDFDMIELDTIATLVGVNISGNATANTVSVTLEYPDGTPFVDASLKTGGDASFFVYDADLVTVGTPTGVVRVGVSNVYTLTFASISNGTHYIKYDPTKEDDYVYLPLTKFTAVTPA